MLYEKMHFTHFLVQHTLSAVRLRRTNAGQRRERTL